MKYRTHAFTTGLLLAILILPVLASGQAADSQIGPLNRDRLNRDLRIMEGILDKLLHGGGSRYHISGRTKGIYLPGYGVVFHASPQTPSWERARYVFREKLEEIEDLRSRVDEEHADLREEMRRHADVIREERDLEARAVREEAKEAFREAEEADRLIRGEIGIGEPMPEDIDDLIEAEEEAIENYRENLAVFFKNYSSAIGQLRPQDQIAVLVNLEDWEIAESENAYLLASVARQDVDRYRRNQLDESDFYDQIDFNFNESEEPVNLDIMIITEIFERALNVTPFAGIKYNNGVYLDGLGALLFLEVPGLFIVTSSDDNDISIVIHENVENAIAYSTGTVTAEKKKKGLDLEHVEADLFDLMASYGHTLRLKPQESILVSINMGGGFMTWGEEKKSPSRILLSLKKQDVDDYNRGVLTLEALKNKLVRQTY